MSPGIVPPVEIQTFLICQSSVYKRKKSCDDDTRAASGVDGSNEIFVEQLPWEGKKEMDTIASRHAALIVSCHYTCLHYYFEDGLLLF